jgi:hypothetical protein
LNLAGVSFHTVESWIQLVDDPDVFADQPLHHLANICQHRI